MIKVLTDLHTHTNASSHAYSTLYENICAAKEKGLELIAMTNHGPSMVDSTHYWHFMCLDDVPKMYNGIKILGGIELNILNKSGEIDLQPSILENKIDVAIASIHRVCYKEEPGGDHTETYLNVMKNPYIDILGHSGWMEYKYDLETVIGRAKEANVCIEINNHTFDVRQSSVERCREIALYCKKIGAPIVVNSDSHFMSQIGNVSKAVKMLEEIDFPEDLIMNLNAERFIKYIEKKKNKKFDFGE